MANNNRNTCNTLFLRRAEPIFEGLAIATGCTVEMNWNTIYEDVMLNYKLAEKFR